MYHFVFTLLFEIFDNPFRAHVPFLHHLTISRGIWIKFYGELVNFKVTVIEI